MPNEKPMTKTLESDYLTGQDNIRLWGLDIHNPVFFISASLILAFVITTLLFSQSANEILASARAWSLINFDSFMMLAVNCLLLFCLVLIVLPVGRIRLGGEQAQTELIYVLNKTRCCSCTNNTTSSCSTSRVCY